VSGETLPAEADRLRVAMVISNALDQEWGSTTHVMELARELGRIAELRLYMRRPEGSTGAPPGAVLIPGSSLPVIGFIAGQARLFVRLLADLRRSPPDVIYSRYTPFGLAPAGVAALLGLPHVIELNGIVQEDMAAQSVPWLVRAMARLSERLHYRGADGIVAVTGGIADDLATRYGRMDVTVIPNGVNCDLFRTAETAASAGGLGLDAGCDYVSFVGNLAPWQGLDVLLEAMPRIRDAAPSARFLIVGDGSERKRLLRRADELGVADACTFTGSVPYTDVPRYITASMVCTAPFVQKRNERTGLSPLKIYEYLACSRPVVTTDLPGVRELIQESGGGIVVPPGDPDALAGAVIRMLTDCEAARTAGERGCAYVLSRHCWRHVARDVLSCCRAAMRERKSR
jgi:glycosyltransferase involved in cell wall biosynthesis